MASLQKWQFINAYFCVCVSQSPLWPHWPKQNTGLSKRTVVREEMSKKTIIFLGKVAQKENLPFVFNGIHRDLGSAKEFSSLLRAY